MIGQLTTAFATLNKGLFDNSLNNEIEFETNLRRRCIFHFTDSSIEIGEKFITASKVEVIDDLLHVMIHVFHAQNGISDFTQNQYHNKAFCDKALELGLIVVSNPTRGWGFTYSDANHKEVRVADKIREPSVSAVKRRRAVYKALLWSQPEFVGFQKTLRKLKDERPHKEYLLKYVCGGCEPPVIIRSGRRPDGQKPLNVACNDCNTNFVIDMTD